MTEIGETFYRHCLAMIAEVQLQNSPARKSTKLRTEHGLRDNGIPGPPYFTRGTSLEERCFGTAQLDIVLQFFRRSCNQHEAKAGDVIATVTTASIAKDTSQKKSCATCREWLC